MPKPTNDRSTTATYVVGASPKCVRPKSDWTLGRMSANHAAGAKVNNSASASSLAHNTVRCDSGPLPFKTLCCLNRLSETVTH